VRRLFCILLLICLPLQGFAMQLGGLHSLVDSSLSHEIDHQQRVEHHHDDDGTVHYDSSEASAEHIQHDCAGPCQFLIPDDAPAAQPKRMQGEAPLARPSHLSNPDLEDPERPPVPAPGLAAGG
jgi:hypothetical protein